MILFCFVLLYELCIAFYVTIVVSLDFIKNTSFGLMHELLNDQNEIVAEAHDVAVMFDFSKNEKTLIPDELRKLMEG